jgi:hypothetical protein
MLEFQAASYGPRIAALLAAAGDRLPPLVIGPCVSEPARQALGRMSLEELFAGRKIAREDFAAATRSGLFLYLSCFDEAHQIAQDVASTTGSYWHGILHRQEPDYSNARYWFHRVGEHAIFPALCEAAASVRPSPPWDAFWFIDACEKASRGKDAEMTRRLEAIQQAEWRLLFDYSYRQALGVE